ncbi:MAG: T9SS type A sorting domain-containing protein [Bacteroidota bacterium]
MKKIFTISFLLASVNLLWASGRFDGHSDPLKVTFIKNPHKVHDLTYQAELRKSTAWNEFLAKNNNWSVVFNEENQMPHKAFGTPIPMAGPDALTRAERFLNTELSGFGIQQNQLVYRSTVNSGKKYDYVNWKQHYQGIEVLWSNVQVKMTKDGRVMQFSLGYHPRINISTVPYLTQQAAVNYATNGVSGITSVVAGDHLKILAIPMHREFNYRLVYEINVENRDAEGMPGRYYTLVDANNGEVLYRTNRIVHISNTDVNISGTLYTTHPYNPSTVEPLRNLKVVQGGTTYYTDSTGFLGLNNTTATTATVSLEGRWVRVRTNNATPSWTVNLSPGANSVTADNNTDIKQRTTYHAVNTVHDFMKSFYPSFTGLDFALPANVDLAGNCNAFYDGSSINFYAAGGGCNATSLVSDVCYHEYGHGINDKFYQAQGFSFDNGGMGEGYADIWALGITDSPILGIGFYQNNPTGFVRRYDINKKVFPQDLVGQVHADGEIIAGCFWDTYLNLGNLQQMMDLFAESFYAGITGPDGSEGQLYQDVLYEVLTLDDNDGDLTNGTPNFCDITSGFAIHGITLGGAVNLNHNQVLQAIENTPVAVDASIPGLGAGNIVRGYYRLGNSGAFTPFVLANGGGSNYIGTIPSQPKGTIIEYYLAVEDNCGTLTNITPQGADASNPNIPYYIMVGYDLLLQEDFDVFAGSWTTGLPSDDATTGEWAIEIPVPSYVGTAVVQPGDQNTVGGQFCAITGNASGPTAGAGENDVDGGKTTLLSPVYDLSNYTNPAFSYYRWYTNDQGATPGTDFWQVAITNDGVNYVDVENINVADHSWRRFAFRVQDYVSPTSTVSLRFIAEDANAGSLIEAGVDDLILWDEVSTGIGEQSSVTVFSAYPNPANDFVQLNIGIVNDMQAKLILTDASGKVVSVLEDQFSAGNNQVELPVRQLAAGLYQVSLFYDGGYKSLKINILK